MPLDELRRHLAAALRVQRQRRRCVQARFALAAVRLLAARLRDAAVHLPVAPRVDAAALQARLRLVPGLRDGAPIAVQLQRRLHLLAHGERDFLAEHVAQNAADQHGDEDQEHNDEILAQRWWKEYLIINY